MRQRILNQRDANQILLGSFHALLDGQRNLPRLAGAEAHMTAFITDDHQRGKRKIFTALDYLGHAVDGNNLVLQVQPLCCNSLFRLPHYCSLPLFSFLPLAFLGFASGSGSGASATAAGSSSTASPLFRPAARAASVKAFT